MEPPVRSVDRRGMTLHLSRNDEMFAQQAHTLIPNRLAGLGLRATIEFVDLITESSALP